MKIVTRSYILMKLPNLSHTINTIDSIEICMVFSETMWSINIWLLEPVPDIWNVNQVRMCDKKGVTDTDVFVTATKLVAVALATGVIDYFEECVYDRKKKYRKSVSIFSIYYFRKNTWIFDWWVSAQISCNRNVDNAVMKKNALFVPIVPLAFLKTFMPNKKVVSVYRFVKYGNILVLLCMVTLIWGRLASMLEPTTLWVSGTD